jgi:hypothetical protein
MNSYYDWALSKAPQLSVPASSYSQTPPTSTPLSPWILSNGQKYIIDQGRKVSIPDTLVGLWSDKQFGGRPANLVDQLPSESLLPAVWTNPYIYYLESGTKHHVTSSEDVATLQASTGISGIRADKFNTIPDGTDFLADGRLVTIQNGDGKIYVVNRHKLTYIPSPNVFNAYGFNWGAIQSFPSTIVNDYPLDNASLSKAVSDDNTYFINVGSALYQLPEPLALDFGIIPGTFNQINKVIVKKNTPVLTRFLYNTDDGAIYYASGEAIHHVMTIDAYRAYGGATHPATPVNSNVIGLFKEAQPLY